MVSAVARDGTSYDLTGDEDAPVVAFIHGLGLARGIWDPWRSAFNSYRVLTYDLYGHGDSAPIPEDASLSLYAKQLAGLLEELGIERASVVGFSIGGMINRRFAIDYPNKLEQLIILNSPHNRGDALQLQVEERAKSVREQGILSTLPDAIKRWFTPSCQEDGAAPAKVTQWREAVDVESYTQAAWVLANGVRELIEPQPRICASSLVMTSENDTGSTPAMAKAIANELDAPEGAVVPCLIVPELKHLGLMENPEAFINPVLDFLRKNQ